MQPARKPYMMISREKAGAVQCPSHFAHKTRTRKKKEIKKEILVNCRRHGKEGQLHQITASSVSVYCLLSEEVQLIFGKSENGKLTKSNKQYMDVVYQNFCVGLDD
ncbi:unnamed protein product [Auanema sp. JU1783]|nr:unnamed protein product [Auanema sp. JU1783]